MNDKDKRRITFTIVAVAACLIISTIITSIATNYSKKKDNIYDDGIIESAHIDENSTGESGEGNDDLIDPDTEDEMLDYAQLSSDTSDIDESGSAKIGKSDGGDIAASVEGSADMKKILKESQEVESVTIADTMYEFIQASAEDGLSNLSKDVNGVSKIKKTLGLSRYNIASAVLKLGGTSVDCLAIIELADTDKINNVEAALKRYMLKRTSGAKIGTDNGTKKELGTVLINKNLVVLNMAFGSSSAETNTERMADYTQNMLKVSSVVKNFSLN